MRRKSGPAKARRTTPRAAAAARRRPDLRRRHVLSREILIAAEELFARHGFQGVSMADVAGRVGISKQNLFYYFPTKEALYRSVLDGVLDEWLQWMVGLADSTEDPATALRAYVRAKLRYSRERPSGSRVYANEIISGAPFYAREIEARVVPALRAQVATLTRWAEAGQVTLVDPVHLMFVLWAATQTYADFSRQMELVMGKPALDDRDFQAAEELVTHLVLRTLGVAERQPARGAREA